MPLSGGIAAPNIVPLKSPRSGQPHARIDIGTYILLETDSPNCAIFFTTDGSKPNAACRAPLGRELTHRYTDPFALRPGRRVVKAVAVQKGTNYSSPIVTKTFFVDGFTPCDDSSDSEDYNDTDLFCGQAEADKNPKASWPEAAVDRFLQKTAADQGFNATNLNGTQINLWHTPTPTNDCREHTFYQPQVQRPCGLVGQQQMNDLANHLTQMLHSSQLATTQEIRQSVRDAAAQAQKPNKPVDPREPHVQPVSPGGGDVPGQLNHLYGHLVHYARADPEIRAAIGGARMGKVLAADFDEDDNSYMVTIQFAKPHSKLRVK